MSLVHRIPVPGCLSNSYVIVCEQSLQAIIIDPGHEDIKPIEAVLSSHKMQAPYIFLTHEHFDHIAGANSLRKRFGSKIVCSEDCAISIGDPRRNMSRYCYNSDIFAGPADLICETIGWVLDWLGTKIRFIKTPGHSPGSICIEYEGILFTGDTILKNVPTRCNLPGGDRVALAQTIASIEKEYNNSYKIFPGHGPTFSFSEIMIDAILGIKKNVKAK